MIDRKGREHSGGVSKGMSFGLTDIDLKLRPSTCCDVDLDTSSICKTVITYPLTALWGESKQICVRN